MLTVRELVEQLQVLDQELPVIVLSDPEGNGFFWVSGADADGYVHEDDLESDRTESVRHADDLVADAGGDAAGALEGYVRVVTVFP